ncbi:DNA primase small subunit PriS [uncultured archaeon]|nr:DNA primase small subunit PriS [uncultured archaeon]
MIIQVLKEYYKTFKPRIKAIGEREFGFGFEKKIDYRHYSFGSEERLREFLELKNPKYASYSAAYYVAPEAKPVEAKTYKKSELIFDIDTKYEAIDGKHEEEAQTTYHNNWYCEYCIKKNAREFTRLIEEFLEKDFGFSENDVTVNYSGSKGFHCHVENEMVDQLSPNARRKIVEYVNGSNLDGMIKTIDENSKADNYWKKQFKQKLMECCENQEVSEKILGKKLTENLVIEKENIMNSINGGDYKIDDKIKEKIIEAIKDKAITVDAQVTIDKSRLIRIPDSIHGDTGLIAKTIQKQDLNNFNPGKDANFLKGECAINITEKTSITFAENNYELNIGNNDVPKGLALLLELNGKGVIENG